MSGSQFMKNLYGAFGRGDLPSVLGAMAPDIRWHEAEGNPYMPSGEAWVGPDAVVTTSLQSWVKSGRFLPSNRSLSTTRETPSRSRVAPLVNKRRPGIVWTRSSVTSGVWPTGRSPSSSNTLIPGNFKKSWARRWVGRSDAPCALADAKTRAVSGVEALIAREWGKDSS